jgi:hypothetical protein
MPKKATAPPPIESVLLDLEARFLLHLPQSELESAERLFFQIEQVRESRACVFLL